MGIAMSFQIECEREDDGPANDTFSIAA